VARLCDLADIVRGVTFDKAEATDQPGGDLLPILRAGNIQETLRLDRGLVYVPQRRVARDQRLRSGDIAICMSSGSIEIVGKTAVIDRDWNGGVGAFCAIIRPRSGRAVPGYVAAWLRSPVFRQWTRRSEGLNIKNIRRSELEQLEVQLPSEDEQRRVVDILDRAISIRELRRQAQATARQIVPALFNKMFGDPRSNPMGWQILDLGEVLVDGIQNGLYRPATAYGQGTRILRIDSFYDGEVQDVSSLRRLTLDNATIQKYLLRPRDIIVNRVNSLPYLGKSAIMPTMDEPVVFESNMMRFSTNPKQALPEYVIAYLQTSFARRLLVANAKEAINQASINQQDVSSLPIPLPSMLGQSAFVERVKMVARIVEQQTIAGGVTEKAAQAIQAMLLG
jgi:type I restriction enzyme, S subunit